MTQKWKKQDVNKLKKKVEKQKILKACKERRGLRKRREELRVEIRNVQIGFHEELYPLLIELFNLEKKLSPNYNYTRLASDTDLSSMTVSVVMAWSGVTPIIKKLVEKKKIGRSKACRILVAIPKKADKIVQKVVDENLDWDDTYEIIRKEKETTEYGNNMVKRPYDVAKKAETVERRVDIILKKLTMMPKMHQIKIWEVMDRIVNKITKAKNDNK